MDFILIPYSHPVDDDIYIPAPLTMLKDIKAYPPSRYRTLMLPKLIKSCNIVLQSY